MVLRGSALRASSSSTITTTGASPSIIEITTRAASNGGGSEKRKSSNVRTNTLMRTVKETHNIRLREKEYAGRDGFEISLCSESREETNVQSESVSGWDLKTMIIITTRAASKGGGQKRGNPAM